MYSDPFDKAHSSAAPFVICGRSFQMLEYAGVAHSARAFRDCFMAMVEA
jgi:hypothetical protein